jgi:hypothetical protein
MITSKVPPGPVSSSRTSAITVAGDAGPAASDRAVDGLVGCVIGLILVNVTHAKLEKSFGDCGVGSNALGPASVARWRYEGIGSTTRAR